MNVVDAVNRDYNSARVIIHSDNVNGNPESINDFRFSIEYGFKKHYPNISFEYGGWIVSSGKNAPFWFIKSDDTYKVSGILENFIKMNPTCHAAIHVKYNMKSHDHIGREMGETGYRIVFQK